MTRRKTFVRAGTADRCAHYSLFPDKVARALPRLDRRSFEAGMHGR